MGFWEIATQTEQPTATPQNLNTPYKVYKNYFSPYTKDGKNYTFQSFRDSVREARNHGLNLTSQQAHAMRLLAKHSDDWFNDDGSLKEGLSRHNAKRATKYKNITVLFYNKIKPKTKKKNNSTEQTQARWAVNNFIKNGYDTAAADLYAGITSYDDLAGLWGGDIAGVKAGGVYGSKAAGAEKAYFDSLSAPQKKAYLAQRQQWINNNVISGNSLANLGNVSDQDMQNYIRNNITNWSNVFYGNNGYADEYAQANPVLDDNTKRLYQLYGITPSIAGAATWTPASPIRTSGFTVSTEPKLLARKALNAAQGSTQGSTQRNSLLVDKAKQIINNSGIENPSSVKVEEKNGELYIDGAKMTLDYLKQICN